LLPAKEEKRMIANNLPPIERKADGSLPSMSAKQRSRANALIREACSYYDCGNCLYLDEGKKSVCVQSISFSIHCKFFWHVLLEGAEGRTLKAQLLYAKEARVCSVCGKKVHSQSNHAKYCAVCAVTAKRAQKAAYARKQRAKVEK
jgi:hypothetical protein